PCGRPWGGAAVHASGGDPLRSPLGRGCSSRLWGRSLAVALEEGLQFTPLGAIPCDRPGRVVQTGAKTEITPVRYPWGYWRSHPRWLPDHVELIRRSYKRAPCACDPVMRAVVIGAPCSQWRSCWR